MEQLFAKQRVPYCWTYMCLGVGNMKQIMHSVIFT